MVSINGLPATAANFPTADFTGINGGSFNDSTGYLNLNASNVKGTSFAISGLPLGAYTVTFDNQAVDGNDYFFISGLSTITPIHVPYADANLLRDDLIGSNSLKSEVTLPDFRREKAFFPAGVDLGAGGYKWQTKKMTSNRTSADTDIAELRFSGLTIGQTYRMDLNPLYINTGPGAGDAFINTYNGSTLIDQYRMRGDSTEVRLSGGRGVTFTATDSVLRFEVQNVGVNNFLSGGDPNNATRVTLTELPNHKETNEW